MSDDTVDTNTEHYISNMSDDVNRKDLQDNSSNSNELVQSGGEISDSRHDNQRPTENDHSNNGTPERSKETESPRHTSKESPLSSENSDKVSIGVANDDNSACLKNEASAEAATDAKDTDVDPADVLEQSVSNTDHTVNENVESGATVQSGDTIENTEVSNSVETDAKSEDKTDSVDVNKESTLAEAATVESITSEGATAGTSHSAPQQSVYHVKWVKFKGEQVAIITQNENGPCPLLAVMNCLLLQAKVKLPGMMEIITSGQLMEYLGDCIFENAPKNLGEESLLNYEQNMSDAMAVFDKLQTGLDVNVRFTGVREFEYTRECIVFDLLNIQLYHGWLADPQNQAELSAVGQCSYNQLVEKIIEQKNNSQQDKVTEALVAEEFLNRSCHQLTYHGLSELSGHVKEGELCVFFRNNHFSTLLKHKNELFTLVTDQGFLTESNVVWETLSNVEGDGHFVDADFRTYRKPEVSTQPIPSASVAVGSDQQIDQDYLVALSLQQETRTTVQTRESAPAAPYDQGPVPLTDHELALRLQEEEDRQATAMLHEEEQQRASQPASQPTSQARQQAASQQTRNSSRDRESRERNKKSSDCTLL